MPLVSIGDMSQQFLSLRNTGNIKSDLARLGQELSTGLVADITEHLGGDSRQFSGVKHSLDVLDAYRQSTNETALLLDRLQLAFGQIDETRSRTADALLLITEHSQPNQMEFAAETARIAFGDIVSAINAKHAGRSVLGGGEVDVAPLLDADSMLSDIVSSIGASPLTSDIIQAVEDWFDNPTGGFSSIGYQGSAGTTMTRNLGANQTITVDIRADDQSIREILKATALAAIVPDIASNITAQDQGVLLQKAGVDMLSASGDAASLQSRVGFLQETVSTAQARLASEKSSLSIAHNDLISADPFDTATRLEAVQLQLETHYTVASRLSRLSLVEYI